MFLKHAPGFINQIVGGWQVSMLSRYRSEAFNAFNNVNFYNPNLSVASSAVFSEFQNATAARVMQLALRYEF